MCEAENSIYCVCGYVVCVGWVSQSPIHPWSVRGGEQSLCVCVCIRVAMDALCARRRTFYSMYVVTRGWVVLITIRLSRVRGKQQSCAYEYA